MSRTVNAKSHPCIMSGMSKLATGRSPALYKVSHRTGRFFIFFFKLDETFLPEMSMYQNHIKIYWALLNIFLKGEDLTNS